MYSDLTQLEQGHGHARCRMHSLSRPDRKCESQKLMIPGDSGKEWRFHWFHWPEATDILYEDATAKRLRGRRPPTPGDLSVSFPLMVLSFSLFSLFSLSFFFFFQNILIVPIYRNLADILGNHAIERFLNIS